MELDQIIFKKLFKYIRKRWNKTPDEVISRTIHLTDINSRLTLLARALTGKSIDIFPAEMEGGWKASAFYLPTSFDLLPSKAANFQFYLYRIIYLTIQSSNGLNWGNENHERSLEESRHKAYQKAPEILKIIEEKYPPVFDFYQSVLPSLEENEELSIYLYGKYMVSRDVFEKDGDYSDKPKKHQITNPTTEIKSKAVEEVEVVAVDTKAQEDFMLTHNFEKVETVEEFSGVWRGFDGDDSLQEDEEALNETKLKHLVRTDEVARSLYQAEFRDLAHIAESKDSDDLSEYKTYPEWDYVKKRYKPDHCKVLLKKTIGADTTYAQKCLSENAKNLNALRRKFAQVHQKREVVKKLNDGDRIDIDALIEWYSDLHAGRTPSDHIYLSKRKKQPDLAVLFLLDTSLSTDSYADGNHVIDVEKEAVILFGEVLNEYSVDFAVSSFYSKTRNHCVYHSLKKFEEKWIKGKQNIGAIEPQGYTRIGPALRHSKAIIENHPATNKWIILLSDGKPNDYDKYEGKYGIADVKQALREIHERHINTYAVAIESTARYYLPQMFGQNHYNILSHADMLIPSLTILYQRINNN